MSSETWKRPATEVEDVTAMGPGTASSSTFTHITGAADRCRRSLCTCSYLSGACTEHRLLPPQSFHLLLRLWCSQRLLLPQSLHLLHLAGTRRKRPPLDESCGQTRLKIRSRHCAAAFSLQVPKSCTDLHPTLLYMSTLGTYNKSSCTVALMLF